VWIRQFEPRAPAVVDVHGMGRFSVRLAALQRHSAEGEELLAGESVPEVAQPGRLVRILFAEEDSNDRELCLHALRRAHLEFQCDAVSTREEFAGKLAAREYDLVLTGFRLTGWTGMDVLRLVRERPQDIPVIMVTGALGEEQAVECFREGIGDYVAKGDVAGLPVAVLRALQKKEVREERRRAEATLRESERRFRALADATASAIFIYQGVQCRYANRAAEEITGYTREELLATSSWQIVHPESRDVLIEQGMAHLLGSQGAQKFEIKILTKQGGARWLALTIRAERQAGGPVHGLRYHRAEGCGTGASAASGQGSADGRGEFARVGGSVQGRGFARQAHGAAIFAAAGGHRRPRAHQRAIRRS
jgi:PAS domain S-box-containing protein